MNCDSCKKQMSQEDWRESVLLCHDCGKRLNGKIKANVEEIQRLKKKVNYLQRLLKKRGGLDEDKRRKIAEMMRD